MSSSLYTTDIEQHLKVRTAEWMHAHIGQGVFPLKVDVRTLLAELEGLGQTKSITRNKSAIHQVIGRYENQKIGANAHAGMILNPGALDLRLFLNKWGCIFSLEETHANGTEHSLHFYDVQGQCIHEVYCTDETDKIAWLSLIKKYRSEDHQCLLSPVEETHQSASQKTFEPSDPWILDVETQWRGMDDVHHISKLLQKYDLTRPQLFRAVNNPDLARRVENSALSSLLKTVSEEQNKIMIFVGNGACTQIFTGAIDAPIIDRSEQQWITVRNPSFTLHLDQNAIFESWITRKNTKDSFVTSLELFDAHGTQIAQLFGQRSEGEQEQKQWRHQTFSLLTAFS